MPALFAAFAALLLLPLSSALAGVTLSQADGTVQIRKAGTKSWGTVSRGHIVDAGDEIKTSRGSKCVLTFDDGSKVEIGPNGSFVLEEARPTGASMRFNVGFMKAWVTKALSRKFQVRTPTAVCSVRGTGFDVGVQPDGNTSVAVFEGFVGVADNNGNETLLKEGDRVDVSQSGLGTKADGGSGDSSSGDKTKTALKREVGLDMTKEEVQAAAALEQKSAMYQEGKAIIDVNGNRVRMEQYIIRPQPDQFKLVVLNERTDRFDYFYYLGTFNKALPEDMSVALQQINGRAIDQPDFILTSYETGRSNTTDSVVERASGGHSVDTNNNTVTSDDVTLVFDPRVDGVVRLNIPNPGGVGNDSFWQTLYQNYTLSFNGVTHHSWVPSGSAPAFNAATPFAANNGIQNYSGHITKTDVTNLIEPPSCESADRCTFFPEPGKLHQAIYLQNADGSVWEKFDNYIISDEGKVASASDFGGVTSGADYKRLLLNWNYQQIITASEFQGRKIDLAVSPKILIQSGLIP